MAGKSKGWRGVVLAAGLLLMALAAGGCSTKDGVSDKPPAKGSGCSLGIGRIFG